MQASLVPSPLPLNLPFQGSISAFLFYCFYENSWMDNPYMSITVWNNLSVKHKLFGLVLLPISLLLSF